MRKRIAAGSGEKMKSLGAKRKRIAAIIGSGEIAGPYVNVENSGVGSNYAPTSTLVTKVKLVCTTTRR